MNSSLRINKKCIIGAIAIVCFLLLVFVSPITSKANPTDNAITNENITDAEVTIDNSTDAGVTNDNSTDPVQQLYKAMLARETDFTIYCDNPDEIVDKLYDESLFWEASAINDPNTSDDYDYLYYNVDQYTATSTDEGVNVTIQWLEDADQLQQVNAKVDEIINETGVRNMDNAYDIAKALHDYIVNITDYDYSYSNYTAYSALFENKTVCQGYGLLYYKLLEEAGVSSRLILGTSEGENHCWLIVKVGNLYYNVDPTWDDSSSSVSYEYFLKGSNSFDNDHARFSQFTTEEFCNNYPTSTTDFNKSGYDGNDVNVNTDTSSQNYSIDQTDNRSSDIVTGSTTGSTNYNEDSDMLVDTQDTQDMQDTSSDYDNSNLVDTNTQMPTSRSRVIENEYGLLIQVFD